MSSSSSSVTRATLLFESRFSSPPSIVAEAPGRVNLIGEHTDYNDGFVMPLALHQRTTAVVGKKNHLSLIRVITEAGLPDSYVEFEASRDGVSSKKEPKWANYVKGVILQYFKSDPIPSFDLAVATDVPLGGGLSSSAALEVAVFTFLEALTGITFEKREKALLCQRAENEHVGVPCGNMDQFISVLGKAGHALLLDCRSHESKYVPLTDPNVVLLVTNSNVKHELTGGEYAQRRAQCYEAVNVLQNAFPSSNIRALRDVNKEQLEAVASTLHPQVLARARHVVGEDIRTMQAAEALAHGDYQRVGKLMGESHRSLRDDYEVSCKELDILVDAAYEVEGVYGSRMTGGGFGGCTITLLHRDALSKAIEHISKVYHEKTGLNATIFSTVPGDGAAIVH